MEQFTESTTFTDDASLSGGCCCGSSESTFDPNLVLDDTSDPFEVADSFETDAFETDDSWEDSWIDVDLDDTEADWSTEPVQDVAPVGTSHEPTVTTGHTIWGDFEVVQPAEPVHEAPVSPALTSMTIGGDSPYDHIQIVGDDSTATSEPGWTTMTIGPSDPSSPANALASLYGVAAEKGDVMSQIMIHDIMASQNRMASIWTMPSVVVI